MADQRAGDDKDPVAKAAPPPSEAAPAPPKKDGELTDEQLGQASGGMGSNAHEMKKTLIGNFPR